MEDTEQRLFNKAIELLSRREHSQKELVTKLTQRIPAEPAVVNHVLERLVELGYQSDERFATAFIRSRLASGLGARRVRQEAQQKGLPTLMIDAVLAEETASEFASDVVIEQVWRKKFKSLPSDQKERAKHYRFLQYRGFSGDDISRLLQKLQQDNQE